MIKVQEEDFDVASLYAELCEDASIGGVVMFVGRVRDLNLGESVTELFLEHYPGMTESVLNQLAAEALERWRISDLRVVHRVGRLRVKDQIVFVGTASQHREDAFLAAQFLMDKLKTQAPFWKKETSDSGDRWLDENEKDQLAVKRW